jgi:hypothetical protein
VPPRELIYSITVQKFRSGKPFEKPFQLAGEINFERDYQVRLNVRSPEVGYLYVLNESPSGQNPLQILFPSRTSNGGSALVGENHEMQIPEKSWFMFDPEQGTETVWLVWSRAPIAEIEAAKRFANPSDLGVIKDTELNGSLKRILKESPTDKLQIERQSSPPQTILRSGEPVVTHGIKLAHN